MTNEKHYLLTDTNNLREEEIQRYKIRNDA
jgi:hypothetical protein